MNLNLLKSKLALHGLSIKKLGSRLNEVGLSISNEALYRRMTGKVDFQRKEIQCIAEVLSLSKQDINDIFFN